MSFRHTASTYNVYPVDWPLPGVATNATRAQAGGGWRMAPGWLCRARQRAGGAEARLRVQVRATGGGAFKYADLFRERLGVVLRKEDEMACLVDGCSFLLKAIRREAFEFNAGEYAFKSAATGAPHPPP